MGELGVWALETTPSLFRKGETEIISDPSGHGSAGGGHRAAGPTAGLGVEP